MKAKDVPKVRENGAVIEFPFPDEKYILMTRNSRDLPTKQLIEEFWGDADDLEKRIKEEADDYSIIKDIVSPSNLFWHFINLVSRFKEKDHEITSEIINEMLERFISLRLLHEKTTFAIMAFGDYLIDLESRRKEQIAGYTIEALLDEVNKAGVDGKPITIRTIRTYQTKGLIPKPSIMGIKKVGKKAFYLPETVSLIRFIKKKISEGYGLKQIKKDNYYQKLL